MRLLLDTHVVIWLLDDAPQLSARAQEQIRAASRVHVSTASLWEIAIKVSIGRLELDVAVMADMIVASGLHILPIEVAHAVALRRLPPVHRDPFDRMLIAQSEHERLRLLTADRQLPAYGDHVVLV